MLLFASYFDFKSMFLNKVFKILWELKRSFYAQIWANEIKTEVVYKILRDFYAEKTFDVEETPQVH